MLSQTPMAEAKAKTNKALNNKPKTNKAKAIVSPWPWPGLKDS